MNHEGIPSHPVRRYFVFHATALFKAFSVAWSNVEATHHKKHILSNQSFHNIGQQDQHAKTYSLSLSIRYVFLNFSHILIKQVIKT